MKITFFKNEAHFEPRVSCTWENAEQVLPRRTYQHLHTVLNIVFSAAVMVYAVIFGRSLVQHRWLLLLVLCLLLPAHELCHALCCWLLGGRVERICFFPYRFKRLLTKPIAYVHCAFCAWSKAQQILLSLFPCILLSGIPAVAALFLPSWRVWLWFVSLLNIATSCFDIAKAVNVASLPKHSVLFPDFSLLATGREPITIHRLSINADLKTVTHRQFTYAHGRLTEQPIPVETDATRQLKREFAVQFDLND